MSFCATSRRLRAETVDDLETGDCRHARSLGDFAELCRSPSLSAGRVQSPIPSAATKVPAAAAKQQHQYNDNQDQFHGRSHLTVLRLFTAHRIF
jgi:hypothetical protein